MKKTFKIAVLLSALTHIPQTFAARLVQEGYWIDDSKRQHLPLLKSIGEFTFDHVNSQGYELYGPEGLGEWLRMVDIKSFPLDQDLKSLEDYPTPEQVSEAILKLHQEYPHITKIYNIGKSYKGRDLLVMKISDHVEIDEQEPEFKYISSMHGNEITGREMLLRLLKDMLESYGKDPRITKIIDNTEVFVMPSMNPDGSAKKQRANERGYDLNRDFPDFTTADNRNVPGTRNQETIAMMRFQDEHNFSLSANFHGGAQVVNYPWDTSSAQFPFKDLAVDLSLGYAKQVGYIYGSREFGQGITNGFTWYEIDGGMQDWSYYWYGDLQLTIELSDVKWPEYSQMDYYYQENKTALVSYMEKAHQGLGFTVPDRNLQGKVRLWQDQSGAWKDLGEYGFRHGEFFKILEPGLYKVQLLAQGIEFQKQVERDTIYNDGNFERLK